MSSTSKVIRNTCSRLLNEYLEKSITHGLRMIKRTEGDSYGRYIWLALMAVILIITHMDIYSLLIQFMECPTETRLSPKVLHIRNANFPAIGICSNNQISKAALTSFADDLFKYQQWFQPNLAANSSAELAQRMLKFSGFLLFPYDRNPTGEREINNLNELLIRFYRTENYSPRYILYTLIPKCEDILKRCILRSRTVNCSDIFILRDYSRKNLFDIGKREPAERFKASGSRNSLQVAIQDNLDDHMSKEFPFAGFRVIVFNTYDFPDVESGSVMQRLISYDREYDISFQPDIVEGSPRIAQFSPKIRRCYFTEEGKEIIKQNYYSFSECILDCRVRSMINHCGCSLPTFPKFVENVSDCTFLDLSCIERWKAIWWQWKSFDYVTKGDHPQSTMELCKHCLPNCDIMTYQCYGNSRPLISPVNSSEYLVGILKGLRTDRPTAIVRFFYKAAFSQVKTHDINGDWIVLLGRYGGICSITYGFSFVAIFEILYFLSGKWFIVWWNVFWECWANWRMEKKESKNRQDLYWNELNPKRLHEVVKT